MMYGYGNSMFLFNNGIIASSEGIDADAQAFITNASITDTTQKNAINQLVLDLKSANIWTKMKAIYPFVGGTASTHRFNLKAPTTNTTDYYLIPSGGITHSANGVAFNGTTGYYNTNLKPTELTSNSIHLSYTSRTDSTNPRMMGCQDDLVTGGQCYIIANKTENKYSIQNTDANRVLVADTTTIGNYIASRNSSTSLKGYNNGTLEGTNTTTSSGDRANINVLIGAFNFRVFGGATSIDYGNKECSFSTIGDGLDDSEALALYNAQNTFNTTLGR